MEGGKEKKQGDQLGGSNSTLRQELMVAWSRVVAVELEGGFVISFGDRISKTLDWTGYWEQRKESSKSDF